MDPVNAIVMLLHPLLASALLVWVWWQYSWRKKGHELKGEERKDARSRHERMGERLLWATFGVILVAFMARAVVGLRTNGDALSNLMPQSLHGFMGPVGFAMLCRGGSTYSTTLRGWHQRQVAAPGIRTHSHDRPPSGQAP